MYRYYVMNYIDMVVQLSEISKPFPIPITYSMMHFCLLYQIYVWNPIWFIYFCVQKHTYKLYCLFVRKSNLNTDKNHLGLWLDYDRALIQIKTDQGAHHSSFPSWLSTALVKPGPQYRSVKAREPRITGFPLKMPRERYGFW